MMSYCNSQYTVKEIICFFMDLLKRTFLRVLKFSYTKIHNDITRKIKFEVQLIHKNQCPKSNTNLRGSMAQWVVRLTRNVEILSSSPIKGPRCFLELETLSFLLSTGWFQERIGAKIN